MSLFSLTFRQIRGSSFSVSRTLKGVVRGQLSLVLHRGRGHHGILIHPCISPLFLRVFVNLTGDVVHRFVGRFRDVVVHHGNADVFLS